MKNILDEQKNRKKYLMNLFIINKIINNIVNETINFIKKYL